MAQAPGSRGQTFIVLHVPKGGLVRGGGGGDALECVVGGRGRMALAHVHTSVGGKKPDGACVWEGVLALLKRGWEGG